MARTPAAALAATLALAVPSAPFPAAVRTNVRGFSLSPFNPLSNAEDWWLPRGR
jgi:hypothetical protein